MAWVNPVKKSIPWVAVLVPVALLVIAASMPKYVGRFYGDGAGLTNFSLSEVWTNDGTFIYLKGTSTTNTPIVLRNDGSLWIGTNSYQDFSLNTGTYLPWNQMALIDSGDKQPLYQYGYVNSEHYDWWAQVVLSFTANGGNSEGFSWTGSASDTNGHTANLTLIAHADNTPSSGPQLLMKTNNVTIFSVVGNGVATANGLFVIDPTNGIAPPPTVVQPIGLFGSMMLSGTTNTVTIGSAGTYYTLTNYGTVRTNGFGANKATGFLTNTVAGYYRITVYASMIGGASDTMEGEVFLNETGREEIALFGSYDAPARVRTMSSTGILYIPANTGISFRLNNRSDTDNISVWRAAITVGTP